MEKRKPGRPAGSGQGLVSLLRLRVTQTEMNDLEWLCEQSGVTLSAYVRQLIDEDTSRLH